MLSKLRTLTRSQTARGSLCSAKYTHDRTVREAYTHQVRHVMLTCSYCDKLHCNTEIDYCETNDTHLKYESECERSPGDFRDSSLGILSVKESNAGEASCKTEYSQHGQRGNNKRKSGKQINSESLFVIPRLLNSKQNYSVVQNSFLSTSSTTNFSFQTPALKSQTDKSVGWTAALRHLMYGEERNALEKDPEDLPTGSLWPLMRGCDTIEEVMTLMEPKMDRQELEIDQYGEILQKLQMIIYKDLSQRYAWIAEEEIPSTYVNLLLNDTRVSEFEYLGQVPSFQKLQENVVQVLHKMNVGQFVLCFSGFVWLGVPAASPTIVAFMSQLDDFHDEGFTALSLHLLSVCLLSFARPDILVARYIHPKLQAMIEDDRKIANDKKTLFSLIFLGHLRIHDADIGIWLTQQILRIVEETDHLKDPFLAAFCMKFCKSMKQVKTTLQSRHIFHPHAARVSETSSAKSEDLAKHIQTLIDKVIINLMDVSDYMSCIDIGRAAANAYALKIYHMPWGDVLKKRSLELIFDENVPVNQKVHAFGGLLGYDMDKETLEKIDSFILSNIDGADSLSATFILDYVSSRKTNSAEILKACERKIAESFETMVGFRLLSKKMFTFLAKCPMIDVSIHICLQTKLLSFDSFSYHHDLILYYLINQKTWLITSPALLKKVSEYLGWCSFRDYNKFLIIACFNLSWSKFKKKVTDEETAYAVSTFEKNVAKRYFRAIKANGNLRFVTYFSEKVSQVSSSIVCSNTLMKIIEDSIRTETFDKTSLTSLLRLAVFNQGTASPNMFDEILGAYATEIDGLQQSKKIRLCDRMLMKIAYWCCTETEEMKRQFTSKIHNVLLPNLDLLVKDRGPLKTVDNIFFLCCVGILPEKALLGLLNVDALAELDRVLEKDQHSESVRSVYDKITLINRSVVLDKPEFQIPWFMGSHAEKRNKSRNSFQVIIDIKEKTRRYLCDTVGEDYFGYQKAFEYELTGGFVCLVDKENQLISYSEKNYTFARELGLQRTIVDFCVPGLNIENHPVIAKIRLLQLEKLGYRVISINEWDFYSMAFEDQKERKLHMKNKILGVHHRKQPQYWQKEKDQWKKQNSNRATEMVGYKM